MFANKYFSSVRRSQVTDYTVNIKACLFELQESREILPNTFFQLYQFHRQKSQIEVNSQNNDQLWQCFFEFCQSLKQVKKYYDQALMLIEQDELMQPICKDAINYLEQHYGRNSIHKVVYHSEDRNSVALALHKLISDVESWDVRKLCSKRSIVYTFFDLAEDAADDFAGSTEKHYFLAHKSEHSPSYFYHQWQHERRTQLFRCAVQDEELRGLVVKYVKLIDERNMYLGSESDLRYFSDQAQLFEAPYIALLEASDEHIPDFIDSYSLTYRWYNHLPEIDLVDRLLTQHPQSSYLKYFYPATGHRMSGNSNYCPPFSDWYLSQLSDPKFVEEQLLICASDIIRAEQVCYDETYSTLTDVQQDDDFINEIEERIEQLSEQEEPSDKTNEDDIRLYFNSDFYDRLALALIGKELSPESAAEFFAKRQELQLRVAAYLRQILGGAIEPAFDVCYGYSTGLELSDETDQPRVTEPLFDLHDVNSFAYVNYLGTNYLLYQQDDKVVIASADNMMPVSFRSVSEGGMYAVAYAMRPEVDSPVHFVTLDWKQGLLQGWHLGQSLPVITLRLNAFQNSLPLELSSDGRILLIGITKELDEEANLNPDLFDIKTKGKDSVVAIDLASGQELCRFEHLVGQTLKLSPTGDFALYSQVVDLDSTDRFIYVDLTTGAEKIIHLPYRCKIGSGEFAISSDGQRVVYKQSVVELATGESISQLTGDDYVYQYEFSQCDDYVISSISEDNFRDIFRVSTGERLARVYGDEGPMLSQNYLDSGEGILYSFNDYSLSLYDLGSELSLDRAPIQAPEEFGSVRISDSVIVPHISRRKGSFSNDEHGTELCLLRFGVEGNSGELVEPKWYSPGEPLPKIGVEFTMSARGIR